MSDTNGHEPTACAFRHGYLYARWPSGYAQFPPTVADTIADEYIHPPECRRTVNAWWRGLDDEQRAALFVATGTL